MIEALRWVLLVFIVSFVICTVNGGGGGGKKVLIKIHVPKIIKHKHHTNVVFVHKYHKKPHKAHKPHHHHHHHHHHHGHKHGHHDHKGHKGQKGKKHHSSHYHHYDYHHHDDHHDHSFPGHQNTHSNYGHHYDYSYGYGNGHNQDIPASPKVPASPKIQKPTHPYFDQPKIQRQKFVTFSPNHETRTNDGLKVENQTITHENIKYQSFNGPEDGNGPSSETYGFPISEHVVRGSYQVNEEPYEYNLEPEPKLKSKQKSKVEALEDDDGYEYGYGDYGEEGKRSQLLGYNDDYTNPNSVAKYTSDIQHGAIGLEDTSYNSDHGNDLEAYINAYKDPVEDDY